MVEHLTIEHFQDREGDRFTILPPEEGTGLEPLELELIEVTDCTTSNPEDATSERTRTPFSLLFRGPPDLLLPSAIHRVEDPRLGTYDLFISPVAVPERMDEAPRLFYEAVFG